MLKVDGTDLIAWGAKPGVHFKVILADTNAFIKKYAKTTTRVDAERFVRTHPSYGINPAVKIPKAALPKPPTFIFTSEWFDNSCLNAKCAGISRLDSVPNATPKRVVHLTFAKITTPFIFLVNSLDEVEISHSLHRSSCVCSIVDKRKFSDTAHLYVEAVFKWLSTLKYYSSVAFNCEKKHPPEIYCSSDQIKITYATADNVTYKLRDIEAIISYGSTKLTTRDIAAITHPVTEIILPSESTSPHITVNPLSKCDF